MTFEILTQILLFAFALSMDAFAVSVTDGLICSNLTKKKYILIAFVFGLLQGLMPLFGYWIIELANAIIGSTASEEVGLIISNVVSWISFALLLFIGIKMLVDGIISMRKVKEESRCKLITFKEIVLMGFATSIDALAIGVSLHHGLSNNYTIFLHISIIIVVTFIMCLIGLFLGKFFDKLLKGKIEIANIIGGSILILLAIWILFSNYLHLL